MSEQLTNELALYHQRIEEDIQQHFHNYAQQQLQLERELLHTLESFESDIHSMFSEDNIC
jgi:hypothetical protein